MKCLLLLLGLTTAVAAFYSEGSGVEALTAASFKPRLQKGGVWIVEFYAPWCGHCQKLKPEYEKVANAVDGVLHVAAVDCDAHPSVAGDYSVKGFPTIKLFYTNSKGKLSSQDYSGTRTSADLIRWAMDWTTKLTLKKAGAPAGEKRQKASSSGARSGFYSAGSDVVELGSEDFEERVMASDDLWMVEFYAPWCGHCKNLKPAWESAATELKGKVHVGAVDCTTHESVCGQFGVQGFPTLKFFGSQKGRPEDYNQARDAPSIVAFALEKWSKMAPPPEVKELTEAFILEKHCTGSEDHDTKQLCLVVFLPHILDSHASGRNAYLAILQKVALEYKDQAFGYLWAEGGKQKGLEGSFGVGGFGYPAAVVYSPKKNAYAVLKAGLDYKHCLEFVNGLRHGFENLLPLDDMGEVETTPPWDGNDAEQEIKDEFDLADIMNEEL